MGFYYHGTSYECAKNIKKFGFGSQDTVWECSLPDNTYLAPACEDAFPAGLQVALEAGQIAAVHFDSKFSDVVVFRFNIPDDVADEYLQIDDSCENYESFFQIPSSSLNDLIKEGRIRVEAGIYECGYFPECRVFYLAQLSARYYRAQTDQMQMVLDRIRKMGDWSSIYDLIAIEADDFEDLDHYSLADGYFDQQNPTSIFSENAL